MQTGTAQKMLRYFLSNLGDNKVILGYLWFTATQPKINWVKGWIAHDQLPIILQASDAARAQFLPQQVCPTTHTAIGKTTVPITPTPMSIKTYVPPQYKKHARVFGDQESKKFPLKRSWDHAIELKPGTPLTLISRNICLSQTKLGKLQKFIKEHMECGTIRPSKSPYTAAFFFIKKKNGKLQPV